MAITIYANVPCNTVDFLSNKGKKPKKSKIPKLKIEYSKVAVKYTDLGIVILKPTIDKICFGFSFKQQFLNQYDATEDAEEYKMFVANSLYQDAMADSEGTGISLVHKKTAPDSYKFRFNYKPPSSTEPIFLQVTPKASSVFMRFEMNPAKFSEKAIGEFKAFIEGRFLSASVHIPYDDLIAWATIFRVDIAIDILGTRPADLEVMAMTENGPVPYKSHVYKSKSGRTETLYLLKKGKSSTEYFYDKRQEQIGDNVEPVYGDHLHTRYECRVNNTTFQKLQNIKNRCARVGVRALDYERYYKMGYTRKMFLRYALERRALEKVLELIPEKSKAKYKQSYDDTLINAWDAKAIWKFWGAAVKSLAIAPKPMP